MVTGEIKTKIDTIWDTFWTGGITNSISVLEQMTYLFFMKMLDDAQMKKEATAAVLGAEIKDPVFKKGIWIRPDSKDKEGIPYESLRWHVFKNTNSDEMFNTVREYVFPFIKTLNSGKESAYSRFMDSAIFLIPNARLLSKIVADIDGLDMNNRDAMGDVYEYILGKMAASGNNGQFRTPRHIIRMMVEMMQPTLKDTICDPAMGSAGFIVESAKYIKEKYGNDLLDRTHSEHFKNTMFHGYDTDQTMLRIGAMNLMLHDVDNPCITYLDSLSNDNTDADKYTLCLANPPFSGTLDKESISKSLQTITSTTKTELLFVALFIRMLQLGGRCASIVPDGVLFGNSKGHKMLRRELVDNQNLQAVISMPAGVFLPYSGVSTAVLVFTKTNAGGTDQVWFYDMKADGLSLDQKRNPVSENDIPDVVARFHNLEGEKSRSRKDQSFLVPVAEIREKDYDLSINKYKEVEREKVTYESPSVIFNRITTLEQEISAALEEFRDKYLEE